eukprot:12851420-Heterocapsa_arctica.AAC.1
MLLRPLWASTFWNIQKTRAAPPTRQSGRQILCERTGGTTVSLHQSAFDVESTETTTRLGSNLPSIGALERFGSLGPKTKKAALIGKDPKTGRSGQLKH